MFKKRAQRRLANGRKQSKLRSGAARRLSTPLLWEGSLEDRRLLAAQITLTATNEILFQGSGVDNDLFVDTFAGDYYFTDLAEVINVVIQPGSALTANGSGTNTVQVINIPLTSQVEIRTGNGDDSVEVISSPLNSFMFIDTETGLLDRTQIGSNLLGVSPILGTIDVIDSGGVALMTVQDAANVSNGIWTLDQTPTLSGSIEWNTTAFVSYGTGVTEVSLFTGSGDDNVAVINLGLSADIVNIDTDSGDDFVEVWSTPAGSRLNIDTGFGVPDTTVIGNIVAGINDIFGDIHVIDSGGVGDLFVNDVVNLTGRNWTLDQNIGGEGTITWGGVNTITYGTGIETATVNAGGGNDFFLINSTSTFAQSVDINAGDGSNLIDIFGNASILNVFAGFDNDTANVFGNSFEVNIDLDGGQDSVFVFDNQAPVNITTGDDDDFVEIIDTSAVVNVSTDAGQDIVRVFDTGADLFISTGDDDDTVTVFGTGFGTDTFIDTGNGSGNVVNIGGDAPMGTGVNSLDNVLGNIYVYGSGDAASDTTVNIDDSGSVVPDSITFWVDFLAKLGYVWGATPAGSEISYDNAVNTLNFWGGSGGNEIDVVDTLIGSLFGTVTSIFTGQGNDSVFVSNDNGPSSPGPIPFTTLIIDLQAGTDRLEVASLTRPGVFRGGDGDDYINASTVVLVPLTIEGGLGDDTIGGGSGNDFIEGDEGDDEISGGDGINTLIGGLGDDDVKGGPGWNAFVWNAGDGYDVFTGGSANDEILASGADATNNKFDVNRWGVGYEVIYNDNVLQGFVALAVPSLYITGGIGSDGEAVVDDMSGIILDRLVFDFSACAGSEVFIDGTIGNDDIRLGVNPYDATALVATGLRYQLRVFGTANLIDNFVTIFGDSGNDYLKADRGAEALANITLDGEAGDDTLEADAVLIGGPGNDTFILPFGINFVDGISGNDRILILGSFWSDSITVNTTDLGLGANQVDILNGLNSSTNTVFNVDVIEIETYAGDDDITITGNGTIPVVIHAGEGDDNINASAFTSAFTSLYGGAGNDNIVGSQTTDDIYGEDGDDNITAGRGSDFIFGGADSDTFVWNNGDGSDVVEGGTGLNTQTVNGSASADEFLVTNLGGRTLFQRLNLVPFFVNMADVQVLNITTGFGADLTTIGNLAGTTTNRVNVELGFGDVDSDRVTVTGTDGDDAISVHGSGSLITDATEVTGLPAMVTLVGGSVIPGGLLDHLTVRSGRGADSLSVQRNFVQPLGLTLEGQGESDFFDVTVQATPGINKVTVLAGNGNDLIHVNEGNVLLIGGPSDVLETLGTANNDSIALVGGLNSIAQTVNGVLSNIDIAGFTGVVHVDALGGNDSVGLTTYSLPTTVMGGDGNDSINAAGMPTGVTVHAGAGDDVITGGDSTDYIYGDDGNDVITAGRGADFIFGGDGSDLNIWNNGDNSDVYEGGSGVNVQTVNGSASGDEFRVSNSAGRTLFQRLNLVPFFVNMADVQTLNINGGDGGDLITIEDLSGTSTTLVNIGLGADAVGDRITVVGTNGDDAIAVHGSGALETDATEVTGLPAKISILGGTTIPGGFLDHLTVRGGRGSDSFSVYRNFVQPLGLTVEGQGDSDFFDVTVQPTPGFNKVTVLAGNGSDLIHVNEGNVLLIGGPSDVLETLGTANNDTIELLGGVNTITQSVNSVVSIIDIAGFTGVVHVDGLGGNDGIEISGYSLATTVMGSAGNDFIDANGMPVGVSIYGGTGNDLVWGGTSDDYIEGGSGRDTILGNAGNDTIFGNEDSDVFGWNPGDGDDTIDGGTGYDAFIISGTAGTDCFHVSPDNTFVNQARIDIDVSGGPAGDGTQLAADVEHISLQGGGGADYFEIASMIPTPVTAIDADLGGFPDTWQDIVVVKTSNAGSNVTVTPSATNANVDVNGLSALIRLYNTNADDILNVKGGFGSDDIYVAPETLALIEVAIDGGGGDDVLQGGQTIVGGSGNDLIKGTDLDDVLLGGLGNDTIYGYNGFDLILGDGTATGVGPGFTCDDGDTPVTPFAILPYVNAGGDDLLYGGDGFDSLNGGFGNDVIYGEDGPDFIGFLQAGMGISALLPTDFDEPGDDYISGGNGNDDVNARAGNDTIYGNDGNDNLIGGDGDDFIDAGKDADNAYSGTGNDTIYGQSGSDHIYGEDGDDLVFGGDDVDIISGGNGNDALYGDADGDLIEGDDGNDSIWGGDGEDLFLGEAGNDLIYGGTGDDQIKGGTGNDTGLGGDGNDDIQGEDGNDSLLGEAGNDFILGQAGNDTVSGGTGNDSIWGQDGNDYLVGNEDADTIYGGLGNDLIEGNDGNDVLTGSLGPFEVVDPSLDGNDTVFGGSGNDAIFGGFGNDFLNGGEGDDQLWGQEGNDTLGVFVYFGAIMYDNGADKFVGGAGDDMIAGALVDTSGNIVPDGNDVAFGQSGNDTIYGGAGGDMLYGGDGDDNILGGTPLTANTMHAPRDPYLPGDGNDTIYGGMGFDNVDGGNDNNLLDAGDDGIRETILGGTGNDMAYTHQATDPVNYDLTALDGGFNHVFHDGGLLEPPVPAVPTNPYAYINWVIPVEYYTGYKTLSNGDVVEHPPLKYRLNPNNGPNGPVKKPIKVKPAPVKKVTPVKKTVAKPNFAGKANTVGKVASALRNKNKG